jgi:Uri superfamily endonuclease
MAMVEKGVYCLCIEVTDGLCLQIGALGLLEFPKGRYIYVGSALNGIDSRVLRHISTSKGIYNAIHWHIDYLLREESVSVEAVYVRLSDEKIECEIAGKVSHRGPGVKGFGCSDCRCNSHLFRVKSWHFLPDLQMEKRKAPESRPT